TITVEAPNPKLELDCSPLYVNTEARPWTHGAEHPRRAGVSSFGFGGSNFHVTLEEYRPQPAPTGHATQQDAATGQDVAAGRQVGGGRPALRLRTQPTELVLLSADDPAALLDRLTGLAPQDGPLPGIAYRRQRALRSDH